MKRSLKAIARGLATLIPRRADWQAMGWNGVALALLSAVLMTLVFPRWDFEWLAWVGLVPIFVATRNRPERAAKWLWYLFGFVWFYASFFWFNVTDYVNVLIWPGIVLMSMVLGLFVLLFAWGAMRFRRLGMVAFLLIPLWWVAIEYLRTLGQLSIPWLFLAHSQHSHPVLIQSASVFGTLALSFLILGCNLLIAEAVVVWRRSESRKPVIIGASVWIGLMIFNVIAGRAAVERWSETGLGDPVRIVIVQPNWDQRDKFEADGSNTVARRLFGGMLAQVRGIESNSVDLVLLPESVMLEFTFPLRGQERMAAIAAEARRIGATIVFGANNVIPPTDLPPGQSFTIYDGELHNSVWSMSPTGETAVFDKIQLVAFGESAPILDWIPGLTDLLLGVITFDAGEEFINLPVESAEASARLGAHICFESSFPDLVRQFPKQGAQLLATITNDGWFLDSAGPLQHWMVQPFRAVENRRWIAQCANTGISSLVNPAGVVAVASGMNEPALLRAQAEALDGLTVYTRHGDWAAQFSVALCAALLLWGIAQDRRRTKRNETETE